MLQVHHPSNIEMGYFNNGLNVGELIIFSHFPCVKFHFDYYQWLSIFLFLITLVEGL